MTILGCVADAGERAVVPLPIQATWRAVLRRFQLDADVGALHRVSSGDKQLTVIPESPRTVVTLAIGNARTTEATAG